MESHYDKQVVEIALYIFHTLHYYFKSEQNELLMYLQMHNKVSECMTLNDEAR